MRVCVCMHVCICVLCVCLCECTCTCANEKQKYLHKQRHTKHATHSLYHLELGVRVVLQGLACRCEAHLHLDLAPAHACVRVCICVRVCVRVYRFVPVCACARVWACVHVHTRGCTRIIMPYLCLLMHMSRPSGLNLCKIPGNRPGFCT